jgi:type III pantothenate kinase
MLLAVDIGNTNIVCGVFHGESLVVTFRYQTDRLRSADEQAVLLKQLLDLHSLVGTQISGSIISSVVPQVTEAIASAVLKVTQTDPLIIGNPGVKTGIRIQIDNPREVGADRIVNSVAARERAAGAAIVVDFGTATTFDCISAEGDYIGGAIVPGIHVSLDGLLGHAARLSRVDLVAPKRAIGKNTTHALQSGIIFGYAELVDGLLVRIQEEMGGPVRTLATGGLAPLVCSQTRGIQEVVPSLTLDGLALIFAKNRSERSLP